MNLSAWLGIPLEHLFYEQMFHSLLYASTYKTSKACCSVIGEHSKISPEAVHVEN